MQSLTFIGPYAGTWTCPPGVHYVLVECNAGGETGADGSVNFAGPISLDGPFGDPPINVGGAGGGGGGYASSIVAVIPGNSYAINAGAALNSSSFDTTVVLTYPGGFDGIGLGGGGVGDTIRYGGDGQSGNSPPPSGGAGGAGGGGGAGGAAGGAVGGPGGFPGGGGGGGEGGVGGGNGGAGAVGYVKISSAFGYRGNAHRFHNTGSTNNPIPHDLPINQFTNGIGIGMRRKWILGAAMLPLPPSLPPCINTQSITHVSTTTTTWTVPPGVTGVLIKTQGEGGNGGNGGNGGTPPPGDSGGSGGGYAVSLLPVLPGETYTITVGSGGTGTDTLFSGPGGTVIGYAGANYGGGGGTGLGQYTANGGDSFVPPSYNGAAGGNAGSGAFGGAGGTGFPGCTFGTTVTVTITDANNFPGCGVMTKTLTFDEDQELYLGDGSYPPCELEFTSWDGSGCGAWGQACVGPAENATCYGLPDTGNTCGNIILYGSAVHDTYAVITGGSGSCGQGNPGLPGTLGSGGGGGGGGFGGGTGGQGGAGFIEISWGNPFGLNGETHQTHTTTQTNFTISNCTPLNQYTTTKGIGMRRKWILGSALAATLTPPPPPPAPPLCGKIIPVDTIGTGDEGGNVSWVVPPGVTLIYVEAQGGGANGDPGGKFAGGGGGGGGYAAGLLTVVPGNTITGYAGGVGQGSYASGIVADYGTVTAGGIFNFGDFTSNGGDGSAAGAYHGPGGYGGFSGSGASGGTGGDGAPPEYPPGPATAGTAGSNYGGGGGGGGADEAGLRLGGAAGVGYLRINYVSTYGFIGIGTHQTHTTGQTNSSLKHCQPINKYTTTKGISMRRIRFATPPPEPAPPIPHYRNIRACNCPPYVPEV